MNIKNKKIKNNLKLNERVQIFKLLINLLIPLLGGIVTVYVNKNSISIYESLKKPILSPSPIIVLSIWTSLYIILGIAAYRFYINNEKRKVNSDGYFFYLIQLIFYFAWTFLFIAFRLYGLSFIWLIVIIILTVITIFKFAKIDKKAALLMLPYILWLLYSAVINYFIWFYNEM